jgi:hypothetical protein
MPRKAVDSEVRLRSLNLKTTESLRLRLEEAAAKSGRAMTHEVEARLDQSFRDETLFGDAETFRLMLSMAQRLQNLAQSFGGEPWHKNASMTWDKVSEALGDLYTFDAETLRPFTAAEIEEGQKPIPPEQESKAVDEPEAAPYSVMEN